MILLEPHTRDLGRFKVRRLLPAFPTRMIGPFIFFDHFGPMSFGPGDGADVRPHPHIGLATVTYLFEDAMIHRDSLGTVQRIEPGDVNWMTAGGGIVHSERSPPEARAQGHRLHGLQTWVALPRDREQAEPSFAHLPRATLPEIELPGVVMRLLAGSAFGKRAPTPTLSPTLYLALEMAAGASFELPPEHEERGVYVIAGELTIADTPVPLHRLAVVPKGESVRVRSAAAATAVILGGAKTDGERMIWWNFVASSRALIDEASSRWREQRFPPVPAETEFIPLPER